VGVGSIQYAARKGGCCGFGHSQAIRQDLGKRVARAEIQKWEKPGISREMSAVTGVCSTH